MICANVINRNPYFGLIDFGDGGLRTSSLSVHGPVNLFNRTHGLGVSLGNDQYGFNDFWGNISYSYKIDTDNGQLGIGLKAGVFNKNFSLPTGVNIEINDAIQRSKSQFALDLGLGLFYRTDNLYAGLSVAHLHQPDMYIALEGSGTAGDGAKVELTRYYYLTSGYNITLKNPDFVLKPSIFVKTDLATTAVDLNANIEYNKKVWAGVSYRPGDAIVGLAGAEVFKDVKVGVAYDLVTSSLGPFSQGAGGNSISSGSVEVILRYCFDLAIEKKPQGYKSVRFL